MKFMLIGLFISSFSAYANDAWIHVVGIDEIHPEQNYSTFYKSAFEFNKACKNAKAKPQCTLYINDDPSLKRKDQNADIPIQNLKIENNSGIPDTVTVLSKIKETLVNSKAGDTVVISLDNHGAPLRSASCVWIKADEQICDQDVAAVLKSKPSGVKVIVSADACFSGAFADLSSLEVCTMTASSRYNVGISVGRGIWNALNERYPKTLADFKEPILNESGQQKLLGSQVIIQNLCFEARKQLNPKEVISELKRFDSYNAIEIKQCRDADNSAKSLSVFASQAVQILNSQRKRSCSEMKVPSFVCDSIERLKKAQPELKSKIAKALEAKDKQQEVNDWILKTLDGNQAVMQKIGTLINTKLTNKEQAELVESMRLGVEPDWKKFNLAVQKELKDAYAPLKKFSQKNKENDDVVRETDQIYDSLKKDGLYEDLMNVQNCLTENAPVTEDDITKYWSAKAKQFPPRLFTLKDYEDAKKCEASISF